MVGRGVKGCLAMVFWSACNACSIAMTATAQIELFADTGFGRDGTSGSYNADTRARPIWILKYRAVPCSISRPPSFLTLPSLAC